MYYNEERNIKIYKTSIVDKSVLMGSNIEIRDFCVIGDQPITFEHQVLTKKFHRIEPEYSVTMGNNIFIGSHSSIMKGLKRNTKLGNNIIVGQFGNIGHDSIIEDFVRIMNSVSVDGFVHIKKGTFIGTGSKIRNRITIGKNCLIGMGSNVVKDIPDNVVAYGNPCRVKRENFDKLNDFYRRFLI